MKCHVCHTEYDDFATYCNVCDTPLLNEAGENIEEKNQATEENSIKKAMANAIATHKTLSYLYFIIFCIGAYISFSSSIINVLVVVVGVLLLYLGTLHFRVAKGLSNQASWARGASTGLAFLLLLGFPIGTLLGIKLLICMRHKDWPST